MATYHATAQRTATVRVAKVPDHVFLHVRFDLTATFPKGVRQLKLEGKALTLVAGDKKLLPDGKIEMGEFRAGPVTQYFRASDTGKPRGLELVYLIPADGPTRYQLNVANASTTVTVPKPTEAPAHPADDVKRKVIAAKMHHTLPGEPLLGYSGLPKLQTQWTNPHGKLLRVELELTPLKSNQWLLKSNTYSWSTGRFNLRTASGAVLEPLADQSSGKPMKSSISYGGRSLNSGSECTAVFAVPADLKDFEILFAGRPMAKGKVTR